MATADDTASVGSIGDGVGAGIELYRVMQLIRLFEEASQALFLRGEVYGSIHLCIGHEAVSAGVCGVVGDADLVTATYRGHGHALALGVEPFRLMAELMGREAGSCGGRAGSMNVVDLEHRLLGCFGIVGGSIAAATGAALRMRQTGGVAVAFFGDGAANQGYFHECLNFAKVLELPVVYVCENNKYGEFTPTEAVTPGGIIARPLAMGIPSERVDGNDVWAVRGAATSAIADARAGRGPQFIEAMTYRFSAHGRGDPVEYRPEGEMEAWRERDPLKVARERLLSEGVGAGRLDAIDDEIRAQLQQVRNGVLAAPFPAFTGIESALKGELGAINHG